MYDDFEYNVDLPAQLPMESDGKFFILPLPDAWREILMEIPVLWNLLENSHTYLAGGLLRTFERGAFRRQAGPRRPGPSSGVQRLVQDRHRAPGFRAAGTRSGPALGQGIRRTIQRPPALPRGRQTGLRRRRRDPYAIPHIDRGFRPARLPYRPRALPGDRPSRVGFGVAGNPGPDPPLRGSRRPGRSPGNSSFHGRGSPFAGSAPFLRRRESPFRLRFRVGRGTSGRRTSPAGRRAR